MMQLGARQPTGDAFRRMDDYRESGINMRGTQNRELKGDAHFATIVSERIPRCMAAGRKILARALPNCCTLRLGGRRTRSPMCTARSAGMPVPLGKTQPSCRCAENSSDRVSANIYVGRSSYSVRRETPVQRAE